MNAECTSIEFKDITKYPNHYITELIHNPGPSFLLFQYGPYLVMNNDMTKYRNNSDFEKYLSYKVNPLLRFMIDMSTLVKISNQTPRIMKEKMMEVINQLPKEENKYSAIVMKTVRGMLKELRNYQYENHVMESTLIDYCPIVPYSRTIVKPEMEHSINRSIKREITIDRIEKFLTDHIIEILQNPKLFMSIDTDNAEYHLTQYENNFKLPSTVLSLCENKTNPVSIYFLMVYLKYCVEEEEYEKTVESLINLNNTYNKMVKGEMVNVHEVVAQLSDIALP